MGFSKISTLSLTDLFVQQIENMILSGELAVGEKLPAARDLSVRMGVSRPVISVGLIELEKLGFVEIVPRQGVYVCDYRRKGTIETLIAIMRYNGGIMRYDEVASLLQVRFMLEQLCMRLVIEKASEEELDGLAPLVAAIGDARTPEECAEAVFLFHHELAVLSGNMLLPLLYHSFQPESVHLWQWYVKRNSCRKMYEIKRNLYQALRDRDVEAATKEPGEYPDQAWWHTENGGEGEL